MRKMKSAFTWLSAGAALTAFVVACQPNDSITSAPPKSATSTALVELVQLGEKRKPTKDELSKFKEAYLRLSLDELIQYRQIQHDNIIKKHKNDPAIVQALKDDMVWYKHINEESLTRFGKPAAQIKPTDQTQLLADWNKANSKAQARQVAACVELSFNFQYGRGGFLGTQFTPDYADEVSQPGSLDCDCRLNFPVTDPNFSLLSPNSGTASQLLDSFGGGVGGRLEFGGLFDEGHNPVFGKGRVNIFYPGTFTFGCNSILGEFTLTDSF